MNLIASELARRTPVWMALSEFYLDTELTEDELNRIRIVFGKSGYSEQEILEINYTEVAPVLIGNMWVWSGFDGVQFKLSLEYKLLIISKLQ